MAPKKPSKRGSLPNHRSTLSLQKTEVTINVYDLLPVSIQVMRKFQFTPLEVIDEANLLKPGKLATVLWTVGASLLHSGVVINGREYAFGGHDKRGMTGVYWTKPQNEPPGGTFKLGILQGFTIAPQEDIDRILREASDVFLGTSYNILNRNCNHFTSYLCERLTGRPGPGWLNRAASIGVALPCVVPREWIAPPDHDTADGELLAEEEDDIRNTTERSSMLRRSQSDRFKPDRNGEDPNLLTDDDEWDSEEERRRGGSGKGKAPLRDTSGRIVPPAERAPLPHKR